MGTTGTARDLTEAAGTGLEIGSYLVAGGGTAGVVRGGITKQILKSAVKEAVVGGTGGALMMGGAEMQKPDSTVGSVLKETAIGAGVGTIGGGVIGGSVPVVSKVIRSTPARILANKILPQTEKRALQAEEAISTARRSIAEEYQKTFPLTPRQQAKEANLLQRTGDNVYTTLAKNDINAGSDIAMRQLNDLNDVYASAIGEAQKAEQTYFNISEATNNAVGKLRDRLNSEVAITDATNKITSEIEAVLKKNKSKIIQDVNGDLRVPSDVMEQLRKIGNDLTPFNASDPMKIGKSSGYSLADAIRDQVEKEGSFQAYREANREWGKIIHAQEVVSDLLESGKTWKLPGMFGGLSGSVSRRLLSGALGFHTGGLGGAVLSELGSETAARVLANPEVRTYFDRLLIEQLGKKQTPQIIQKLKSEVMKVIEERGSRLQLPAGITRMPDPTQFTPSGKVIEPKMRVEPAAKTRPTTNPKTGRIQTTYLSTPKSMEQIMPTATPINKATNIPESIPQTAKKVVKQVDNLTASIKKAKASGQSFDEWVKGQGETVYHQTSAKFDKFDTAKSADGSVWFTDNLADITDPSRSTGASSRGRVVETIIPKKLKFATPEQFDSKFADQLIQEGYDGVFYPGDKTTGAFYQIFNMDQIKTRSQLKTEWNKIK